MSYTSRINRFHRDYYGTSLGFNYGYFHDPSYLMVLDSIMVLIMALIHFLITDLDLTMALIHFWLRFTIHGILLGE